MRALICLVFFLTACTQNDAPENITPVKDENQPVKTFTILALGDSLTEGLGVKETNNYPAILAKNLPDHIEVINAGLSGETSTGLKSRLNWVLKQKPDLTILNIGANDAMRGLPLELTQNNIDEIISTIIDADSDVILAGMQIYNNLGKDYVTGFASIYPGLAEKYQLPLIPFFLENVAGLSQYNQNDMIHPNAAGYEIIVEKNILPVVNQYLKTKKP
ncbi:MAG: arylesterase [Marinicellaceae bacterium]